MPKETEAAMLSRRRGQLAARIKDPEKRKEFIARQGSIKPAKLEEVEMETSRETNRQALQSYKRGGIVKKTGPAFLHKGEKVIPKRPSGAHAYDFRKQRGRRASLKMKFGR